MWKSRAALASILLAGSMSASAITTNLGPLGTEGFGNFLPVGGAVFSDTFIFSLNDSKTINGLMGWSGINTIGLVLQDSGGDTLGIDTTPASFSFDLTPGFYTLNVVGFGATPSSFYGGLVTAVPEPETYALMLAGLGMVGFLAGRRKKEEE